MSEAEYQDFGHDYDAECWDHFLANNIVEHITENHYQKKILKERKLL